jgi:thymidylate synthase ThyX
MDVILAGYNLDKEFIEQAKRGECDSQSILTPETISAAYARISRYPDPVNVLRENARKNVVSARKSNQKIVFDMGHHSVAEHVIFNIDILGLSRLTVETLEESRLCAFTEKSQRYVTADGDFIIPPEFEGDDIERFKEITTAQNTLYFKAFPVLFDLQKKRHPQMNEDAKQRETLEGWAKEDARFILNMATKTQLGFSSNARNLEYIIRKLRHHPLAEAKELGHKIFAIGSDIAPSLIILSDPKSFKEQFGWEVSDEFIKDGKNSLKTINANVLTRHARGEKKNAGKNVGSSKGDVTLLHHTENPDVIVIAALLHSTLEPAEPYATCLRIAQEIKRTGTHIDYIRHALERLSEYDAVFREFEHATFTFEMIVSSSEFAQWKRHRMMALTKQPYDPRLGYTYPETIIEAGFEPEYKELYERTSELYWDLAKRCPEPAQYVLTNGHKRRILITVNMRELYHIARLRMDSHAQWEIRRTATNMIDLVAAVAPAAALLACGKSEFKGRCKQLYLTH